MAVKKIDLWIRWLPIICILAIILFALSSWTNASVNESIPIPLGILVGYIIGVLNVYAELVENALT